MRGRRPGHPDVAADFETCSMLLPGPQHVVGGRGRSCFAEGWFRRSTPWQLQRAVHAWLTAQITVGHCLAATMAGVGGFRCALATGLDQNTATLTCPWPCLTHKQGDAMVTGSAEVHGTSPHSSFFAGACQWTRMCGTRTKHGRPWLK